MNHGIGNRWASTHNSQRISSLKSRNQNSAATKRQIGIWQHWSQETKDNDRLLSEVEVERMKGFLRQTRRPAISRYLQNRPTDRWKIGGSEKWLLNSARNANKPTPVASAITTKKVNAPRRLASMRLLNHVTCPQKTRKIEVRYDPEQLSASHDKRVRTTLEIS